MKKTTNLKISRTTLGPLDLERVQGGSLGGGKSTMTGPAVMSGKCDSLYSCAGGHCPVEK